VVLANTVGAKPAARRCPLGSHQRPHPSSFLQGFEPMPMQEDQMQTTTDRTAVVSLSDCSCRLYIVMIVHCKLSTLLIKKAYNYLYYVNLFKYNVMIK